MKNNLKKSMVTGIAQKLCAALFPGNEEQIC